MKMWPRIARQYSLIRDYLRERQRYAWISHGAFPVSSGEEVLMVNFTDWIPRAIMDGLIAASLRLRGCTPVILTNREYVWSQRYLRIFGVRRFIFFDELLREAESELRDMNLEDLLHDHCSFSSLYNFTWQEIGVGRHVLSTVVRQLRAGSIVFEDPVVIDMLMKFFPLSLRASKAALLLFERIQPAAVLFLEKGYTPYGELFDAAIKNKLNVIQYFHGHRSDVIVMKRYSTANRFQHPFSLTSKSWRRVREIPWTSKEEQSFLNELKKGYEQGTWMNRKFLLQGKKMKSSEELCHQLSLDPHKKTVVIFSHVLWDATFFFGENLFPDYEKWLVETVKAACDNSNVNWIIKLHPDYVWKMKQMGGSASPRDTIALDANIGTLPSYIQVVPPDTDISTYSFFGITDYCITVRGTIGIEAPCFGIPVITAGTGRYSGLGFTNDSSSVQEYLHKIRHIEDIPPLSYEETSLARRHAWALFSIRPLPFTSCEISPKKAAVAFEQEAIVRVHSLEGLKHAKDIQAFLDWILHSDEEDYLHTNHIPPQTNTEAA